MRKKLHEQLPIVEPSIQHPHADELAVIDALIKECPQIPTLIYQDLVRGLKDPNTGREGQMTADQVIRTLLVKQMNGFSYKNLTFHLADSRCYRNFCGFGFADDIPSKSSLQRDLKRVRPETLEQVNCIIVRLAIDKNIEDTRKIRSDCTVTETNIHEPTDSSLLEDCVRVLARLMEKANNHYKDILFTNHLITDLVVWEGNPADSTMAVELAARQIAILGRIPSKIAYDGGFASKQGLWEIKELGIKDVCFSKKCGLKVSDMVKNS
ncbi:MAG: transposase [Deltaproteobacteria bacterium]|nr:transposase [Deltaproteobacteria bacterium]